MIFTPAVHAAGVMQFKEGDKGENKKRESGKNTSFDHGIPALRTDDPVSADLQLPI